MGTPLSGQHQPDEDTKKGEKNQGFNGYEDDQTPQRACPGPGNK
jgi:hypothetical protein